MYRVIAFEERDRFSAASFDSGFDGIEFQPLPSGSTPVFVQNIIRRRLICLSPSICIWIGEAADPWSDSNESVSGTDGTYRNQLNLPPDGIMATIRYPRLGIDLPVRHGTSKRTLDADAGHLYGTSLPIGGENTHSVISAHTGLADRLMLDKLNGFGMKAERGDLFHIDSAGRTLTYKVVSINVVTPDDFTRLKIEPGRDIVTLLTCTPYGINDHRLLVTGERTAMSETMEEQCESDGTTVYLTLYVVAFWIIVSVVASATLVHNEHGGYIRRAYPSVAFHGIRAV